MGDETVAGEIQTVLGRVPAETIGMILPHEHTRCVLWHIPNRWDYWQLTGEEDLILPELARYRAAGGSALVDVSLDAIGRDPARLLGFGHDVKRQRGLAGAFWSINLDDASTRDSADADSSVEAERGGGNCRYV